jgi:ligand-binding sensor domain-containing protein/signal transduction histidine kinase
MRWLIFLLLSPVLTLGQAVFSVRHLTTRDGLLQGSCYYILKDSRGFVWMSSQNGLNRFDGSRFAVYRFDAQDSTTIGKGEIRGLVETPKGDLWVGTEDCLSQYVRRTNSFRRVYATNAKGQRISTLQAPFYADDSTVWYGSTHEGIVRLNFRTGRKTCIESTIKPKFSIALQWILHDPKKQILTYLLPCGLVQYNYRTHQSHSFFTGKSTDQSLRSLPTVTLPGQQTFQCLFQSRRTGHYCLTGPQGIFEFDQNFTRLIRYHSLPLDRNSYRLASVDEDSEGNWWLGVEGAGLWQYSPDQQKVLLAIPPGNGQVTAASLLTNQIGRVYVDNLGLVWVNSDPFGVDVVYPTSRTVSTIPDNPLNVSDLNTHPIRGLCEDRQGHIWIGTTDGGIRRYDPKTGAFNAYLTDKGVRNQGNVRQIVQTRNGRLLVASLQGLLQYNPEQDRFIDIPNPLCQDADCRYTRGIVELPDGKFVLASYGGLFLLSPSLKPISRVDSGSTYFGTLYFDPVTSLLYASRRDQDLVVYRYQSDQLRQVYITLGGHNIMDVYPDPARHCLWLCSDRGLVQVDSETGRALRTYTIRDGLPDDVVYNLLPDRQGFFWLSTNNGLAKFSPVDKTIRPIVSTKGREYNSVAALVSRQGLFYFGGVHGLDCFSPEQLTNDHTVVPVRIVDFQVNDQPYKNGSVPGETKQITLTYNQRTLSIGLATLDYFSNGQNQLFYKLSSVDPDWVPLWEGNTVRYADLSPATYLFQARALDAYGRFTPTTPLQIVIQPPFWQRWWFWTLMLLLVLSTVAFLVDYYNRRKLAQQERLLRNTLATQEDERKRIARDLHDDVGNTLAAAKGILERTQAKVTEPANLANVAHAYGLIDKASSDLRTITHDLMPIEFDTYSLADVVAQRINEANRSGRLHFEFILFGTVRRLTPERELVTYRIIAELMQNAQKHGGAGVAYIQLGYYARDLMIEVQTPQGDQSIINSDTVPLSTGIGQKNIRYRAEYLQAELTTDSNADSHTVLLNVPYDATSTTPNPASYH